MIMDDKIALAVIGIIGSIVTVFMGRLIEKRIEIKKEIRDKNKEQYETLMTQLSLFAEKLMAGNLQALKEGKIKLQALMADLSTWSSPKVLDSYANFLLQFDVYLKSEDIIHLNKMLEYLGKMITGLRKDLGLKNRWRFYTKGLNEWEVGMTFMNFARQDTKKYLSENKKR